MFLTIWAFVAGSLCLTVHLYGLADQAQHADAIVVLGAGLRRDGRPGPALTRRSERAAELWRASLAPVVICTGGRPGQSQRSEADACSELLRERGVPAEFILLEDESRSTEENAMFTKVILDERSWDDVVLVSDGYHLLRARWLFEGQGITVYTSPAGGDPLQWRSYAFSLGREIAALHWLVVKNALRLPTTYIEGA